MTKKLERGVTLFIAILALIAFIAYCAGPSLKAEGELDQFVYLPIVSNGPIKPPVPTPIPPTNTPMPPTPTLPVPHTPTPTPTPVYYQSMYIVNETGGELCYELVIPGFPAKCTSQQGSQFFGTYGVDHYEWWVMMCGGYASGSLPLDAAAMDMVVRCGYVSFPYHVD